MEEWKTVTEAGLEDYQVSNYGNVKLLARDVPTHIVNRGRDMIVTAHRKEKLLVPSYENGRPIVRLRTKEGVRKKLSLPLLLLKTFKLDSCPGDVTHYTAAYLDGNSHNNHIDNLMWVAKSDLMKSLAYTTKGEAHDHFVKYRYIVVKVNNQIVGYFENTTVGEDLFRSYGIETSAASISRALHLQNPFYLIFDLSQVTEEEYVNISLNYQQINLKLIYDMIMEDRRHRRKYQPQKVKVKKEIIYRDKIIKPEKQIIEKIVYVDKQTNQKVNKPRLRKTTQSTAPKQSIGSLTDEDFIKDIEKEKRDTFKRELLRRLQK